MNLADAIEAYEDCVPMAEIAKWYGVTRQAVWKAFKKEGVETRKGIATRRSATCDECGSEYEVTRSEFRRFGKKHFCSDICYGFYLRNDKSYYNRHLQRAARRKVSEIFELSSENVVHHIDSNHLNHELWNLMVFKNHSDHLKYHHQIRQGEVTVKPIWDGRDL